MSFQKAREKAKMTQLQVAEALGIRQAAVSNWERGLNTPTATNLVRLADLFKCSVDDLLREDMEE